MRKNFPFTSTWPYAAALTAALVLVASINVLWWDLDRQASNQTDLVDHTHQVIAALEETLAITDDLVIGQRGYALTHEKDFLLPYENATNRIPTLFISLRSLVRDNLKQIDTLHRLEPVVINYERLNRQHIANLATSDPLSPDLDFRRTIRDNVEQIHLLVQQMIAEENSLLNERQASSQHAAHVVTAVNVVAGLVSMALIVLVFSALRRENFRRRLSEAALQRSHEQLEDRVQQRTLSLFQSEAERKRLEQEILETSDKEMQRIGQDLHDGVGQQLTALSLFTRGLQKEVESQSPQLAESCDKIGSELREVIRQVRVLSHGLSPVSLEENGLVEAFQKLADDMKSTETDCRFENHCETQITDPHLAAQLYRIGQEAVTNAAKHSGARLIHISLKNSSAITELKIRDDGRGFSTPRLNGHAGLGLRAMRYRADVIGASIKIDSAPGNGTQITCAIQGKN